MSICHFSRVEDPPIMKVQTEMDKAAEEAEEGGNDGDSYY